MNVLDLKKKLENLLDNDFKVKLANKIGQKASEMVKERTRSGLGVRKNNAPEKPLKALSPRYIKRRQALQAKGKLSRETTPSKSNLTKTGDMLDDIKYKSDANSATIFVGDANREKAARGKKDRPFMNLSKKEINEINNLIEIEIANDIKKNGL